MTSKKTHVRILSYNIHKGFSGGKKNYTLDRIKEAIQLAQADIVFLQEVIGVHKGHQKRVQNWPTVSQFEYLADTVWPHYAYGKNAVYDAGHHGNAILSKFPIIEHSNTDISQHRYERRGLLHAVLELPDQHRYLHCICVHLGLFIKGQTAQLTQVCERVKHTVPGDSPLVVAGDFNDWSRKASKYLLSEIGVTEVFRSQHGRHARTFPSRLPLLSLDRIYTRGIKIVEAAVLMGDPWRKLSDHAAVTAKGLL